MVTGYDEEIDASLFLTIILYLGEIAIAIEKATFSLDGILEGKARFVVSYLVLQSSSKCSTPGTSLKGGHSSSNSVHKLPSEARSLFRHRWTSVLVQSQLRRIRFTVCS
jgi:hypothetical protein